MPYEVSPRWYLALAVVVCRAPMEISDSSLLLLTVALIIFNVYTLWNA